MTTSQPPVRVAIVCLGNICRSPMAHVVLESRLADAGLTDRVHVSSAGTGDWHVDQPMDQRAAEKLQAAGYDPSRHRARTFTIDWYADHDLLLAMDHTNFADMVELAPTVQEQQKVRMFRSFDPVSTEDDLEVPDPWFGGDEGFDQVLETVVRTCDALVAHLDRITAD